MIRDPGYIVPGDDRNRLHDDRDCHALATADVVDEVSRSDHRHRKECEYCHADEETADGTYPCPCGNGEAKLRTRTITEPFTFDGRKQAVHMHYKHDGCPFGGTVVVVDGEVFRREGPLFDPARYGVSASD